MNAPKVQHDNPAVLRVAASAHAAIKKSMVAKAESIPIKNIVVLNRARKEMKHLGILADSLLKVGMLHPVVVNSRHELIAGGRRIEAAKSRLD